jgi:four helix bundle protein
MSSFRELRVWQRAIVLAELVYRATEDFPKREIYGLAAQMRRAAVSISSNVAEGQGRLTSRDSLRFLGIARGSLFELETQLELATRFQFLSAVANDEIAAQVRSVASALAGYINNMLKHATRRKTR